MVRVWYGHDVKVAQVWYKCGKGRYIFRNGQGVGRTDCRPFGLEQKNAVPSCNVPKKQYLCRNMGRTPIYQRF